MAQQRDGPEKKGEELEREIAPLDDERLHREDDESEKRHEPQKLVLWPPTETPIKES